MHLPQTLNPKPLNLKPCVCMYLLGGLGRLPTRVETETPRGTEVSFVQASRTYKHNVQAYQRALRMTFTELTKLRATHVSFRPRTCIRASTANPKALNPHNPRLYT